LAGDLLISVNNHAFDPTVLNFEQAIRVCSTTPPPRILRFLRSVDPSAQEIQLANKSSPCAVFELVPVSTLVGLFVDENSGLILDS
jgi:hypothetical protein